jgi:tellurite resistance protein TehA-like permease
MPSDPPTRLLDPADLAPASFGVVMATGIVSIGSHAFGMPRLATGLFELNVVLYAALTVLTALRLWRHPRRCAADLFDHRRGPGYFTAVAGTAILGSEALLIGGDAGAASGLLALATLLWLLLTYAIFAAFTIKDEKPTLQDGIDGTWLLAVVATQSVAVLATLVAPRFAPRMHLQLDFAALAMWLWGGMLYIWTTALIFHRYMFFRLPASELTPPYWINMGAMAISTLAGALLVAHAGDAPVLAALLPFLRGFTVFYWAAGTWWIPLLLVLGAWRYLFARHPMRYGPQYWAVVFPLGMYAVATHEMNRTLGVDALDVVAPVFLGAALLAWAVVAVGALRSLIRSAARGRTSAPNAAGRDGS